MINAVALGPIELKEILSKIIDDKESYPVQKFGAKYWKELSRLSNAERREIIASCSLSDSMNVELRKGIAIGEYFDL